MTEIKTYGDSTEYTEAEIIEQAYELGIKEAANGKVATYIPELAKANANDFGIYYLKKDGSYISYGEVDKRFTIQSICKVITLAFALNTYGVRETFKHVKMEPSGDSFSSIIKLDTVSNLPYNPMINAGAIQVISLIAKDYDFNDLLEFAKKMCMDDEITLNESVYNSEKATGNRNKAIVYLLKSKGVLISDEHKTLDLYFKMCSLNVNAKTLAKLGLLISNEGYNPFTGEQIIHSRYIRTIKSLMFTCGMYDGSGEFGVKVGIPSKSGVGGGITSSAKGNIGIGIYGPSLDERGNSISGITALEHISHKLHLHVFDYQH